MLYRWSMCVQIYAAVFLDGINTAEVHKIRLTSSPPQQGPKAFCQFLLDTMLRQVAHGRILEDSETDLPEKKE